jgi:tetratricopeptide (TPR) repeat protein
VARLETPMATDTKATAPQAPADWRKRLGLLQYLRDVAIVAVILGVGLFFYKRAQDTDRQVREFGRGAKELMYKDSLKAYAQAEQKLLAAYELNPKHGYIVSSLGELYGTRWIDFGVEADAAKCREWAQRADKVDARINERYGAVLMSMLGDKKFAEAEKYATDLTKRAASSHVVNGLGRAFRGEGKLDEARVALKKAADIEWRNARFADDMADLYLEDGDFANALGFYNKGIEASSDHVRSQIGRARAQIARGQRVKDASDVLTELAGRPAEELGPKLRGLVLIGMAELRLFEEKYEEAQKFAADAVAAYPNNGWAHYVSGKAAASLKDAAKAASSFDKALELDKFVPEFYYGAASALLAVGDNAKAQAMLDAYLKGLKEDDRLHLAYGNLMFKVGNADEALKHFDKALELNSFNANAHFSKGALLFEAKKDMDGAKKELELALEVQEYFPEAYTKLGEILFAKKEWADGCQQFAQTLIQMKALNAPRERLQAVRDAVNTRLVKEAKQREMAKAWMEESDKLIR